MPWGESIRSSTASSVGNSLLVGPRQTGKTTYLKLMIHDLLTRENPRNILFFACDMLRSPEQILQVIKTFDLFAGTGRKYVFLDEVTWVEGWGRAIKFILDSPLSKDKVLKVSGSSSLGLKKERFPGRPIEVKEFLPLGFREFCNLFGSGELRSKLGSLGGGFLPRELWEGARNLTPFLTEIGWLFQKYLECGGYPKALFELMEEGEIKGETYRSVYEAVMFDVTKLARSEKIALSVMLGIVRRYGSKFSLNALAKEMEIGSHVTVRDYLEILEGLYAIRSYHQLDPKRAVPLFRKERKVYFLDPFLYRAFCRQLGATPDIASLVEGVVGEHLRRKFNVYFFSGRKEIDFLIGETGIEVKWQPVRPSDFPRLAVKNKILVGKEGFEYVEKANLVVLPVPVFLLLL